MQQIRGEMELLTPRRYFDSRTLSEASLFIRLYLGHLFSNYNMRLISGEVYRMPE